MDNNSPNCLLYSNNVHYAFENPPSYYIKYSCQCRYKGDIIDTNHVYCKNDRDFLKLIRYWNSLDNNWVYIPV